MGRILYFSLISLVFSGLILVDTAKANESVTVDQMTKSLAFGQLIELNDKAHRSEQSLMLRLWRIPSDRSDACEPETDADCGNDYFLSVATLDDYPEVRFYRLPQGNPLGEFQFVKWLSGATTSPVDRARILLRFTGFKDTSKPVDLVFDVGLDGVKPVGMNSISQ